MTVRPNKTDGILNWDFDNAYPQRIRLQVQSSGRAVNATNTYARFIEGNGFRDLTFWKAKINDEGLTMDKLLRQLVKEDYAILQGFAIHMNWNANFKITELNYVPFEHTRLTVPDYEEYVGMIALHRDWARNRYQLIRKADIKLINVFNPDPAVIQAQVDKAGGWDKYKGQIFWYSAAGPSSYPVATFDPVIKDVDTDAQIQIFKNNIVRRDFMDNVMLIHKGKFATEKERGEFKADMNNFQGAERAGNIMLVEVETEEQVPELKPFNTSDKDKKFQNTENSVQDNIRRAVMAPKVLCSDDVPGSLGTSNEINNACKYYSGLLNSDRRVFEETFQKLFQYFEDQSINPSKDFSIDPIMSLITPDGKPLLADTLGVGGTQSLVSILEGTLQPQQKINTLILLFGLSTEDATAMVNGTILTETES